MKSFHHFYSKTRLASIALALSLCLGPAVHAQLLPKLIQTTQNLTQDLTQATLKISPDLLRLVGGILSTSRVPVIVQPSGSWSMTLDLLLLTLGARTTRTFQNINARAVELPAGNVLLLAASSHVAGIAAGNEGKDASGQKIYGRIHSPGIEPSVITVGAANTFGTDSRSDDTIATYSSRGPTRGYRTDLSGVKHYDNLVKPELVAPGNKIIDVESPNNTLVTGHPELDAGVSPAESQKMMRLSGTSMATPAVAGAAALNVFAFRRRRHECRRRSGFRRRRHRGRRRRQRRHINLRRRHRMHGRVGRRRERLTTAA